MSFRKYSTVACVSGIDGSDKAMITNVGPYTLLNITRKNEDKSVTTLSMAFSLDGAHELALAILHYEEIARRAQQQLSIEGLEAVKEFKAFMGGD